MTTSSEHEPTTISETKPAPEPETAPVALQEHRHSGRRYRGPHRRAAAEAAETGVSPTQTASSTRHAYDATCPRCRYYRNLDKLWLDSYEPDYYPA
jgi:hypothetical protein